MSLIIFLHTRGGQGFLHPRNVDCNSVLNLIRQGQCQVIVKYPKHEKYGQRKPLAIHNLLMS